MKILRFVPDREEILIGEYSPDRPDTARVIEGDILGAYKTTAREARILQVLAPIVPVNILALGINYKKHGDETAISYPEQPVLFIKVTSSITGPGSPVILPAAGPDHVDYEAELAVVIGQKGQKYRPRRCYGFHFRIHLRQRYQRPRLAIRQAERAMGQGKKF